MPFFNSNLLDLVCTCMLNYQLYLFNSCSGPLFFCVCCKFYVLHDLTSWIVAVGYPFLWITAFVFVFSIDYSGLGLKVVWYRGLLWFICKRLLIIQFRSDSSFYMPNASSSLLLIELRDLLVVTTPL